MGKPDVVEPIKFKTATPELVGEGLGKLPGRDTRKSWLQHQTPDFKPAVRVHDQESVLPIRGKLLKPRDLPV